MIYTAPALAAAALLAVSTPALASPAGFEVGGAVGGELDLGPLHVGGAVEAEAGLHLCKAHHGLELGGDVKIGGCGFFSVDFRNRMNTPAHLKYEEALELYHDITHLIRHTLMTRGLERLKHLIEIAAMINEAFDILDLAESLNAGDRRKVRRSWIHHEIKHLRGKLSDARWIAKHLPNLCLAEDVFHFVVDASVRVVEFAVAVPVVVGAAIGVAIHEAAHLVARAFHFMVHVLKWTLDEIEYAFLMFKRKVKHGLHKIEHGLHKIGHAIKEGIHIAGEAVVDAGSIVVDIGHHLFHHHRCHNKCSGNVGAVIVVGEEKCECEGDDGLASFTEVCVEKEEVCSVETFKQTVQAHYDVQISWTQEIAHEEVRKHYEQINTAVFGLNAELKGIEEQVVAADFSE